MKELVLLLPEIYLLMTLIGVLASEIGYQGESVRLVTGTALLGLTGALLQVLLTYPYCPQWALGGALAIDGPAFFFKILFLLMSIQAVFTLLYSKEVQIERRAEYCAFIVAAALAMCLTASAANVLLGFLALQFVQILFYFLSAFGKNSSAAIEAALKQWAFSILCSFLFLIGIVFLFAWTQALSFHEIRQALIVAPLNGLRGWVVFSFVFLGLSFQLGVFPMYLWVPDGVEGAPTPVSGFLFMGSCTAALSFALRFFLEVFSQPAFGSVGERGLSEINWPLFLAVISGATLLIGPLLALRQKAAKRMLACLLVSEGGFFLLGLLVLDPRGIQAIFYCVLVEIFCVMGAFYTLSFFSDEAGSDRLIDLRGALKSAPPECLALLLFLGCLIGLPPLPGFVGKFALIESAVEHRWYFLSVLSIVSMALSVGVWAIFASHLTHHFVGHPAPIAPPNRQRGALLFMLVLPLFLIMVFSDVVFYWAEQSLKLILW
jgi:NADH-quinone oxidoreductase subunit N